jgi:hypothetical protein
MSNIGLPKSPNLPIAPNTYARQHFDILNNVFRLYFSRLDANILDLSTPDAGATTARPSTSLAIGQQYFDTTIGRPIWWNGTNWINAAGTIV